MTARPASPEDLLTARLESAKGAPHTSLGRRPRSGPSNEIQGLKARHIALPQTNPDAPHLPLIVMKLIVMKLIVMKSIVMKSIVMKLTLMKGDA